MNLFSFAFVDPSMFFATMTLKYGRHFSDNDQPRIETPFQDCQRIVLRGPADGDWSADREQADYPFLAEWPSAGKLIEDVSKQIKMHLAAENLQLGQVVVRSLAPSGVIGWHIEDTAYAMRHHRFVLLASPCAGGSWYSAGESLAPGMGNLTYINHRVLHSYVNLGPVPQISLIVDVRAPTLQ
jgi:hypothetical protein